MIKKLAAVLAIIAITNTATYLLTYRELVYLRPPSRNDILLTLFPFIENKELIASAIQLNDEGKKTLAISNLLKSESITGAYFSGSTLILTSHNFAVLLKNTAKSTDAWTCSIYPPKHFDSMCSAINASNNENKNP